MSVNSILNLMRELDLRGALAAFERMVSSPQELDAMSTQLLLETLLQNEVNDRLIRKQQNLLRMSHLPYVISPSDIAYDSVRGDEFKAKLVSLMTLDFIKLGQNLTIFGSAGTGKSYMAAMLGRLACMSGYTTLYYSASALIDNLQLSYGSPNYQSKLRTLSVKSLLILDDFCLTEYTPTAQNVLFDVLNARYGKKSTVIVSQKLPDAWLNILGGSALAESIVERAGNNNYTLILKGDSRRSSLD